MNSDKGKDEKNYSAMLKTGNDLPMEEVTVINGFIHRKKDNISILCPHAETERDCGAWCPACVITDDIMEISCFPRVITFKVKK